MIKLQTKISIQAGLSLTRYTDVLSGRAALGVPRHRPREQLVAGQDDGDEEGDRDYDLVADPVQQAVVIVLHLFWDHHDVNREFSIWNIDTC